MSDLRRFTKALFKDPEAQPTTEAEANESDNLVGSQGIADALAKQRLRNMQGDDQEQALRSLTHQIFNR